MRDGVKIAIDLYLPEGLEEGARVPTILHQTRYHRSMELRWPFSRLLRGPGRTITRFVTCGYAWVSVDARGSGASFGTRSSPWSPDEVRDGAEIVDWIVDQPWSDGKVGSFGGSYDGTTAEFLLVNRHPAVKAVAPLFALFDVYTDIAYPGGIHLSWFTEEWGRFNRALDENRIADAVDSKRARLMLKGVRPVEEDHDRSMLAAAVRDHTGNYDVHAEALSVTYRDDRSETVGWKTDDFSPHTYIDDIRASGAAIYSYSGWFDGAYPHSAIKRFLTVRNPGSRLVLGPWPHGGGQNISPYSEEKRTGFDHVGELLRFFDCYLKGIDTGIASEPPVHYFTIGDEKWRTADTWPPPGAETTTFYFAEGNRLTTTKPTSNEGYDTYRVDCTAGTGKRSRWDSLIGGGAVAYPDRNEQDGKLLCYITARLDHDMEVTGHPVVTLFVSSTATDGAFFVYLEDVDEEGHVEYVTEGQLRAIHRKLSNEQPPYVTLVPYRTFKRADAMPLVPGEIAELTFDLLPTSYVFKRGHAIRVAVAGADKDHFAIIPDEPPTLTFYRTALHPSRISLPTMPR
jgi:putative CocE/NonD family hydrolase